MADLLQVADLVVSLSSPACLKGSDDGRGRWYGGVVVVVVVVVEGLGLSGVFIPLSGVLFADLFQEEAKGPRKKNGGRG